MIHVYTRPEHQLSDNRTKTLVVIGQVSGAFGIRGEIKIRAFTESPEAFERSATVYIDDTPFSLGRMRVHKGAILIFVEGIQTPEQALALKGCLVKTDPENLPPKEDDEFYWYELIGMKVQTIDGIDLGRVAEIIPTGANDVLVVEGPCGEVLLPMIDDVVKEIDTSGKKMVVDPLEGLVRNA